MAARSRDAMDYRGRLTGDHRPAPACNRLAALIFSIIVFVLIGPEDALRAEAACFAPEEPVTIVSSTAPLTLDLADGRAVRLADLSAAAPEAADAVADWIGEPVLLRPLSPSGTIGDLPDGGRDRHGRILGDIVRKDTIEGLREQLLSRGLALVDPAVMSGECLETSFSAERRAERSAKGVWSRRGPVLTIAASSSLDRLGETVLVEGTVLDVGQSRRTIFLNFGTDWRTDFTAMIVQATARTWTEAPAALAGERVRIRGVLEAWNGGLIKVEHPAQIERLDAPARPR